MPVLGCNVNDLLADASCYLCLSDTDLIKAKLRLREQIYANAFSTTERTCAELLKDSVAWRNLSPHQKLAVDVRQVAQDAINADVRSTATAAELQAETACCCGAADSDLLGAIEYLECLTRQT